MNGQILDSGPIFMSVIWTVFSKLNEFGTWILFAYMKIAKAARFYKINMSSRSHILN